MFNNYKSAKRIESEYIFKETTNLKVIFLILQKVLAFLQRKVIIILRKYQMLMQNFGWWKPSKNTKFGFVLFS